MIRSTTFLFFSVLILVFSFLLLGGCSDNQQQTGIGATVKDYPVVTVKETNVVLNSDYPAMIEGQQNVEIRPKIDGYIDAILVDEGAPVKRGQLLFRISAPQYEQEVRTAKANIEIAEANVKTAEMEANKVKPLVEKGIISEYELESAKFNLQSKQAALAQANAALVNAQVNLGYTAVTSPVDGVIGTLPYKIGSLVGSNTAQPLTTVSNISNIYAYFSINEKQALAFSANNAGATVKERLAAIPPVTLLLANGSIFPHKGRIETASGLINATTGSIRVRATFPNPGNVIRSGSSGTVRIPSNVDDALLVPQKSTYEIQGKKFVYLVDTSGTVKSGEIEVRENSGGQFYVVEDGLQPGDQIILEGVASLREGAAVAPREVNVDSVYRKLRETNP